MLPILRYILFSFICVAYVLNVATAATTENSDIERYYEIIKSAGWGEDSDKPKRREVFDKVTELLSQKTGNLTDLQENATAMREKEQSTANKLLGGATMAATGIGGMMLASNLAEQNANKDAEMDMTAYLETFRCDYGAGKSFKGGQTNIELPGTAELIPLYAEYVQLANDLKLRKEQLGMKAGIESEKILDSATTGLYDDTSNGITSGAYASLARALQNPDGEDAQKWQGNKDEITKKLKTGAIVAGVGVVGGVIGNQLINANGPKNRAEELATQRQQIQQELITAMQDVIAQCNAEIEEARQYANEIKAFNSNWSQDAILKEFVDIAGSLESLKDVSDITKIKEHPICE